MGGTNHTISRDGNGRIDGHLKRAARLLDRDCVNRRGLDLSKEVLWVSVGQRATELLAIKVVDLNKILPLSPARASRVRTGPIGRIFF